MALNRSITCDGKKSNGDPCGKTVPLRDHGSPIPTGWSTVTSFRKPTADDIQFLGSMSPMLERAREKEGDVAETIDQMTANMIERYPNQPMTAHLCPDHELPVYESHKDDSYVGICG